MNRIELAGKFADIARSELFQESMEGVLGGAVAGLGLLGTDTPLPQVAIQTLAGMGLGTGIGMLGSRAGAALGRYFHKDKLQNQEGLLAMFGRGMGQKTLPQGAAEVGRYAKSNMKNELLNQKASSLMREAIENPQAFNKKYAGTYNIDAETFKSMQPDVVKSNNVLSALDMISNLPEDKRKDAFEMLLKNPNVQKFNNAENLVNTEAANTMDSKIEEMAELMKDINLGETNIGDVYKSMLVEPDPITGEHVGRAVGRFIGDEVGVISGLALGGALAGSMGIKSEKDKKIEELQAKLSRQVPIAQTFRPQLYQ